MIRSFSLSALVVTLVFSPAFGAVTLSEPSCDGRVDPIGIDNPCPAFSWKLESPRRGARQTAYRIEVASSENVLRDGSADLWDSGKIESNRNIHVLYNGKPLESGQECVYRVTVWDELGEPATTWGTFSLGLLHPEDWKAKWIGTSGDTSKSRACPWFHKTFVLEEAPKEAKVYVNALGYFELYINGEKVGEDVLVPAVTQFTNRSLYLTYDVTKMLHPGKNVVALWMGRGWYTKGLPGVEYDDPTVRLQLEMKDAGGKSTTIVTDESWKTADSCISRIGREWRPGGFGGERVDFGKNQAGWNTVDYDDSAWSGVQVRKVSPHTVSAQVTEPNRVIERLSPKTIEAFGNDVIVDFGRNMTGWVEWRLPKLPAGTKVTLEYADRREGDKLWSFNQTDEIISAGGENEVFRSHFNYHGFRYVVIRGLPKGVEPGREIAAARIRTNYRDTSQFACSDPLLQQIHDMIKYTLECLSLGGYIVDCTTIERLGYGGDGHGATEAACTCFDLQSLYVNWQQAWRDSQRPDGDMPHTAPNPYNAGGGPVWCGFILTTNWYLYEQYGDPRVLERNYEASKRWLGFVEEHCKDDILRPWPFKPYRNWYLGEWASPGKEKVDAIPESVDLVNNCFRIYCYDIMAKTAKVLGHEEDAEKFAKKAAALRPLIHNEFYKPDTKTYATGRQVDLTLPLSIDLMPESLRAGVLASLEKNILQTSKGHLDIGLVGHYFLAKQLVRDGRQDLLLTMLRQTDYPGYGHMLEKGATATWEHWDGARSHMHNCYSGTALWFYRGLAGIRPDETRPGYRHFTIAPEIGDLASVSAEYDSIQGPIKSAWNRDGNRTDFTFTVPANATATILLPAEDPAKVTESGKPLSQAQGVKYLGVRELQGTRRVAMEVESGQYRFGVEY